MIDKRPEWDSLFMTMAYLVGMRSLDQSSRIGSVIVDPSNSVKSVGYNGLPRGVNPASIRGEVPYQLSSENGAKYQWTEHAERNAIYNAGRNETSLVGCTMYINLLPCSDCARGIIQSGITKVIVHEQGYLAFLRSRGTEPNIWTSDFEMVNSMFDLAGITFEWFTGEIVEIESMFSGKWYDPKQFDERLTFVKPEEE